MRLLAIAHEVPSVEVTNSTLIDRILGHEANRVPTADRRAFADALSARFERAGAVTRFHRAPAERAVDFGLRAGRKALSTAGLDPGDIDLLIYVGVGRGFLEPATANVFQHRLGLVNATCFDILDACASWMRALDVARHLLSQGSYRRVMILNCEFNFEEFIRWDLRSEADLEHLWGGFTVGEAATATIVENGDGDDEYLAVFRTSGGHHDLCQIPLPHARQFAEGPGRGDTAPLRFFVFAADLHQQAIGQLHDQYWAEPRLAQGRWDLILGHSTSVPAARAVFKLLKLDAARGLDTFPRYGNTVSASIPLALSLAHERRRLARGDRVLLVVASAGLTTGFCSFVH